jgi:glutathione S-transferase
MSWIRSDDTLPIREERSTTTMFYERTDKTLSPAGSKAATKLLDVAARLLAHGGEHIGSSWSIADADLAFMLQRLILNGGVVPERVLAYAGRVWQRPTVRAFVERERPAYVAY